MVRAPEESKSLSNETAQKKRFGGAESRRTRKKKPSDMELMKERFAKLFLGEDMSGGGKGVSSALALSNAITNLAASVFGEQKRLEPMNAERKAGWRKEIGWLLSVTDHIVEFAPSKQKSKDGNSMEIMTTRQRTDLHMNVPALRKIDAMLIECLDNFKDQDEFSYVSEDDEAEREKKEEKDEKWWIPTPKVPPSGLSEVARKWLQFQKESLNQLLKAAMAINAQVLSEMAVPENYIESLPKNGRESLGDSIYKIITVDHDHFDPNHFLSMMDLSSDDKILDLKNRIEASVVIWKRKMNAKDGKSPWGSAVSLEKRELFEERAETILLILKQKFPGIPQSSLEISKIQHNGDVGHAILEGYSRILETMAFTIMSRIEDILHADSLARNPSLREQKRDLSTNHSLVLRAEAKFPSPREELEKLNSVETLTPMTLSSFKSWRSDRGETDTKEELAEYLLKENETMPLSPMPKVLVAKKKFSYLEKIENFGGLRSPTARH